MSLVTFLSIARNAMATHQRSMDVTANNIANAQTPGYSRQRMLLSEADPLRTAYGAVGRGVSILGITRARDAFHDTSYRQDNSLLGQSGTMADLFGQIEAALNEPTDTGTSAALDSFFHSFSDLANSPSSSAAREAARQSAQRLSDRIRGLDGEVGRTIASGKAQIQSQVDEVNALTQRVADLNTRILSTSGGEGGSPDLQDQRDALVDQLSGMVGVKVTQAQDGTLTVSTGSAVLVDHGMTQKLAVQTSGNTVNLVLAGTATVVDPQSGSLKGLVDMVDTRLPAVRAQLDQLAQQLVTTVNAAHRAGYTATGATGVDFFDPAGVTAGTIRLSSAVTASTDNIATGATAAPGDGSVASQIAALGDATLGPLGNRTLRGFLIDLVSSVGTSSKEANQDVETYQTLTDRSDTLRQSVSGVNLDEEMISLITQQQAYGAAARLVKIADDMMNSIINMMS